ncbi:ImmA/IrrE family metallo-endopeptidase [Candidatus Saccharibacteria bacterium TM7i]|nr:ImmA/IrrE family metallo-endopeptidase [Candidatus Saccharibacteria bacterium TM7i]
MASIIVRSKLISSMVKNRRANSEDIDAELNLKSTSIAELLAEDRDVDFKDIQSIAKYFKKPWSYLLLEHEETMPTIGRDHRTVRNVEASFSSDMLNESVWAEDYLDEAKELSEEGSSLSPTLPVEHTPAGVRDFFDISTDDIFKLRDDYAALKLWVRKIESTGVYVAQRRIPDETIRAYSTSKHGIVLIVVNTRDSAAARIFSLMHEYCHVLFNTTGLCDFDEHNTVETKCNRFAADVLMPAGDLAEKNDSYEFNLDLIKDEEHAIWLSRKFKVSQAAMFIRLLEKHYISEPTYRALERRRALRKAKKSSGGDYYKAKINAVGVKYASLVLDALSRGVINRKDSSVLLGVGEYSVVSFKENLRKNVE